MLRQNISKVFVFSLMFSFILGAGSPPSQIKMIPSSSTIQSPLCLV